MSWWGSAVWQRTLTALLVVWGLGLALAACTRAAEPVVIPSPTSEGRSVLRIPIQTSREPLPPLPTATPPSTQAAARASAEPAAKPPFGERLSAVAAERAVAWSWLTAMFAGPQADGVLGLHEQALQRYLGQAMLLEAPQPALYGLRLVQQRIIADATAQRQARHALQRYWQTQHEGELAQARQAQQDAAEAFAQAERIAEELRKVLARTEMAP